MDVQHSRTAFACSLILVLFTATTTRGDGQAAVGHPFGVARITVPLDRRDPQAPASSTGFSVRDADGRIFYPAFTTGRLGELLSGLLGNESQRNSTALNVSFLFTGQAPLQVTVDAPTPRSFLLTPSKRPARLQNRLLTQWWRDYNSSVRQQQQQAGDYPPLVDTYLTSMLSQRLGLRPPLLSRLTNQPATEWKAALELLLGAEKLRASVMRETMSGQNNGETASQSIPPEVLWTPPAVVQPASSVQIEPIAMHVPAECLYIRFGSFANYRWLSRLMKDYGGDIGRMITLRGRNDRLNEQMQYQLALKESMLSEAFGGQVIADVAIIGRDLFLREGAALGILFQATNNLGLSTDFRRQRNAALQAERDHGATLETVTIAGHDVSLLSTPDNRLRSFYATDGDFHLVTTSRQIAERFFEAGEGRGALGDTHEFQHARQTMPIAREDTIFAFFPSAFWTALMSPQYQIELRRRLKAVTDIELIELAMLAATAEKQPADTIEDLVQAGLLPAGFGRNADGSGPIIETERVIDSLRGARGSFQPIADIELQGLTPSETTRYLEQANYFQSNWKQMDPLMVGIKRFGLDRDGLERITIDANVSPLAEEKYGWVLSLLGPPSTHQIASVPGDIVTIQARVKGGPFSPGIPAHQLFLGVQDTAIPTDLRNAGFLQALLLMRQTPGYLGSWPRLGFLDLLPLGLSGRPNLAGISQLPLGAWRWQGGDFSVLSFQRHVLEHAAAHLRPQATDNPAQIRLHVGNLAESRLSGFVNALNYRRARQASEGNARLLNSLSQQLHVPRELSLNTAERLLDTQLVCALGGEYELVTDGELSTWRSTSWPATPDAIPPEYQAPLLGWFRGLETDLTKIGDQLILHAEIDMQRKAGAAKIDLPFFNLFGGEKKKKVPEELPAPKKDSGN